MATVPARRLIAVVDHNDIVTEVVKFDGTRDLVRECKKLVDISAYPEIERGWRLRCGGIERPPFDGDLPKGGE